MKIASGSLAAAAWIGDDTSVAVIGYGTIWVSICSRSRTERAYSALSAMEPNSPYTIATLSAPSSFAA